MYATDKNRHALVGCSEQLTQKRGRVIFRHVFVCKMIHTVLES